MDTSIELATRDLDISDTPANASRLVPLDAVRGITIATRLRGHTPGSWNHIYAPLEHADWHGWTMTDLVFPFFLFIVGVAISLAFGSKLEDHGGGSDPYLKIVP